jgi:hypothetical protein
MIKFLAYSILATLFLTITPLSAGHAACDLQPGLTLRDSVVCGGCDDLIYTLFSKYQETSPWDSWQFQGDFWAGGNDGFGLGGIGLGMGRMIGKTQWLSINLGAAHGIGQLGWTSAGVSWRQALSSQSWWGANVFYDLLSNKSGSDYGQIGLGLEHGWRRWTLRANAYLPVTGNMNEEDGGQRGVSSAWRGLDSELQYAFFRKPRWIDGQVAAGFFWGETPLNNQKTSGAKLRANISFGKHVYVQGEWRQNGHQIGLEWRVFAGLRFTFGGRPAGAVQPVIPGVLRNIAVSDVQRPLQASVSTSAKEVVNVQPTASAKAVVNVGPTESAKSAKSVLPVAPAKPTLAPTLLPAGMFQPVQRTLWPIIRPNRLCDCLSSGGLEF